LLEKEIPMQDGSRPLGRHGSISFLAGAVAAGLVVISPPTHADDETTPVPPPPPPDLVITGVTVGGPQQIVEVPQQTLGPKRELPTTPATPPKKPDVVAQNTAPKVHTVASYAIPNLPGTFANKVEFYGGDPVTEQHVLAADTTGQAMPPNLVRVAYQTQHNDLYVFYPGTGRFEKVGAWPAPYPGLTPPGQPNHTLAALFSGPGGPEWLDKARKVAVVIAAAVITGGAVAAFGPGIFGVYVPLAAW
jgi:hypothetical protein